MPMETLENAWAVGAKMTWQSSMSYEKNSIYMVFREQAD
jgi:hypothetical protein